MTTGLDTNILCYLLDPAFPEHRSVARIRELSPNLAINPTVLHESYHTLVYDQKWVRDDAKSRLGILVRQPYVEFCNQTKSISMLALDLAGKYSLGGRDSLILANFMANHVPEVFTHDSELLRIGEVDLKGRKVRLTDPVLRK